MVEWADEVADTTIDENWSLMYEKIQVTDKDMQERFKLDLNNKSMTQV